MSKGHAPLASLDSYNPSLNDVGLQSARAIVPLLLSLLKPASIIDVGCGPGNWLLAFLEAGVTDVFGVDQNDYGKDLRIDRTCFAVADLTSPFHADRTYDLVICVEVAEHLMPHAAPILVKSLTALGPVILFSAAIPFQGGTDHRNEQWPEYWRDLFEQHAFVPVDCIRPKIWDDSRVAYWYTQNVILYVHRPHLTANPLLRAAKHPPSYPLSLVHPRLYLEKVTTTADARFARRLRRVLGGLRRRLRAIFRNHTSYRTS
jgi:SAM-dependent methyltransferase